MKETTKSTYYERIYTVLIYIQENLDEELSLDTLANLAHFSPTHFHRIFKGMMSETLSEHIRRIRLERAAIRLALNSSSVTTAAFDAGYTTVESFSRAFKKVFACAPSQYSEKHWNELYDKIPGAVHYLLNNARSTLTLNRKGEMKMEVSVKDILEMRVAYKRHTGPYAECDEAWKVLCDWADANKIINAETQFLGICHDDPQITPPEKIRYDACMTVDGSIDAEGEVGIQTIPGGKYAITLHKGPYENLEKTYAKLFGVWLPESGHQFREQPSFEIYLNSPEHTKPEDLLTEIYLPIK